MRSLGSLIDGIINDIGILLESIENTEQRNNRITIEENERQKIIDSCSDHAKHLFELQEFDQRDAIFNEMQRELSILKNTKHNEAIQLKAAIKIQALCKGFLTRKDTKKQYAAHIKGNTTLRANYFNLWRINATCADGAPAISPNRTREDDSGFVVITSPTTS